MTAATEDRLARIENALERITLAPGMMQAPQPSTDAFDQVEAAFRPASRVVTAVKWVLGLVIPIFLAGGAYYKFRHDVAFKKDIEDHIENDLVPVKHEVQTIHSGVDILVAERQRELQITKLRRHIDKYKFEHDQAMADYRSARDRNVWTKKPTRDPEWIRLENELETLLEKAVQFPVRYGEKAKEE